VEVRGGERVMCAPRARNVVTLCRGAGVSIDFVSGGDVLTLLGCLFFYFVWERMF
jgi:hypothetical protein